MEVEDIAQEVLSLVSNPNLNGTDIIECLRMQYPKLAGVEEPWQHSVLKYRKYLVGLEEVAILIKAIIDVKEKSEDIIEKHGEKSLIQKCIQFDYVNEGEYLADYVTNPQMLYEVVPGPSGGFDTSNLGKYINPGVLVKFKWSKPIKVARTSITNKIVYYQI